MSQEDACALILDILKILYNLFLVDESILEHILERCFPCRHKPGTRGFSLGDSSDLQAA